MGNCTSARPRMDAQQTGCVGPFGPHGPFHVKKRLSVRSAARSTAGEDQHHTTISNPVDSERLRLRVAHGRNEELAPVPKSDCAEEALVFVFGVFLPLKDIELTLVD